jgi:putative transcriptional regulator
VAVLLPATLLNAALPKLNPAPQGGALAGQFLIASPKMGDPRFRRTVILMVKHSSLGALGIVINRPVGEETRARFLARLGENGAGAEGSLRLFTGGPVQPEVAFVVHTDEFRRRETIAVGEGLAVTSGRAVLVDIGRGRGPKRALVAFGYAGWGPGQLEGEIAQDAWVTAAADPELVFDVAREKVWDEAMARRPKGL